MSFSFGQPFTRVEARDLVRVGQAAFLADRAFRRSMRAGQWTRELTVVVPVEEPERWERLASRVASIASFVTHDRWSFEFKRLTPLRHQPPRRPLNDDAAVALFSGGLDSLCGAAFALAEGAASVFVSHSPPGIKTAQARIVELRARLGRDAAEAYFANFRFSVHDRDAHGHRSLFPERSRRTRPLLFLSMAGAVALELRIPRIRVFENGVLAVNLPFRRGVHGPLISRHAHPEALRRFEHLLSQLWPFRSSPAVENPFSALTKGEEIQTLRGAADLAHKTVSCEYAGQQVASLIHWLRSRGRAAVDVRECGLCYPCLVRRAALHRAGLLEPTEHYVFDARRALENPRVYRRFPLFDRLRLNAVDLKAFCTGMSRITPAEFVVRYSAELALLTRDVRQAGPVVRQTYELYRRFANEALAFMRS